VFKHNRTVKGVNGVQNLPTAVPSADAYGRPCHALERRTKALQMVSHRQEQTYHVERRYLELIREEAEAEGVSITEVVNRALRVYFERRKNGAAL
jgi:hypothetical protein